VKEICEAKLLMNPEVLKMTESRLTNEGNHVGGQPLSETECVKHTRVRGKSLDQEVDVAGEAVMGAKDERMKMG
jgi:hypothetical protein